MRLNQMRAFSRMTATGVPGPEGSIQKIFWSELNQRLQQIAQEILGPYGQLLAGDPRAVDNGMLVLRLPAHARQYHRGRHFRSAAQHHRAFCSGPAQKLLWPTNSEGESPCNSDLSESQEFLKDSARKFFAGECPSAEMRRLMETDTAYDDALWAKLAEQGYTGIIFPEEFGGVGLGKVELMLLMEEAGRALLARPVFFDRALAGAALDAVATPANKKKYLEPICEAKLAPPSRILEASASWNPRRR